MRRTLVFFFTACAATFAASSIAATPSANREIIILGDFNTGKALAVIKGWYDSKKTYTDWKPGKPSGPAGPPPEGEWPLQTLHFSQGGKPRIYFFSQQNEGGECQTCGAAVSALVLTKVENGWRVDAVKRNLLTQGVHGYAREGKLITVGPDVYGVLFETGGGNRGYYEGAMTLVYQYQRSIKLIDINDTSAENSGACDDKTILCYSFDSRIEFLPSKEKQFYDIQVTTDGTEDVDGRIVKIRKVRTYVFKDTTYVLTRKSP